MRREVNVVVLKKRMSRSGIGSARSSGASRGVQSPTPAQIQQYCKVKRLEYYIMPKEDLPPPPTMAMNIFPSFSEFIEFGGACRHVLTNTGSNRLVFKVKCSNNSLFKVSPVYSFLDVGGSVELQILRQEGPTRNDKLVIMYKEAKRSDKDPKKSFEVEGVTAKKVIALITRDTEEA